MRNYSIPFYTHLHSLSYKENEIDIFKCNFNFETLGRQYWHAIKKQQLYVHIFCVFICRCIPAHVWILQVYFRIHVGFADVYSRAYGFADVFSYTCGFADAFTRTCGLPNIFMHDSV